MLDSEFVSSEHVSASSRKLFREQRAQETNRTKREERFKGNIFTAPSALSAIAYGVT